LSWVASGRLLRRAGQAVLRAPIAGRPDRDVLPGRSGPVAVPVPVRLEHDRLGEGPVGDRAGPAWGAARGWRGHPVFVLRARRRPCSSSSLSLRCNPRQTRLFTANASAGPANTITCAIQVIVYSGICSLSAITSLAPSIHSTP
jgi:hypothetical protein